MLVEKKITGAFAVTYCQRCKRTVTHIIDHLAQMQIGEYIRIQSKKGLLIRKEPGSFDKAATRLQWLGALK
jgi:hypothetical protein